LRLAAETLRTVTESFEDRVTVLPFPPALPANDWRTFGARHRGHSRSSCGPL